MEWASSSVFGVIRLRPASPLFAQDDSVWGRAIRVGSNRRKDWQAKMLKASTAVESHPRAKNAPGPDTLDRWHGTKNATSPNCRGL